MDPDPRSKEEVSTSWSWWANPSVDLGSFLWTNSKFKDFDIVIGDQVLRVDKCVLAARSPVFAAMLSSGLTETTLGQVNIQDFDYDTVDTAIKFLYSQRLVKFLKCSSTLICELLRFGHKYDVRHLIDACLNQVKVRKNGYDTCEKKFLMKLAFDLGCDQILNPILNIFGAINEEIEPCSSCNYMAIGDVLLVQDDTFKDLKIICDGGTEFSVHKCILALRSPIFGQMIETMDQEENNNNNENTLGFGELTISRINAVVFENAIRFFYTGCIAVDESIKYHPNLNLGLLEFAERFRVEQLVTSCLQKINGDKNTLGKEVILIYIENAFNFESKKILDFMLGIFGTLGFDPFYLRKASTRESYWK